MKLLACYFQPADGILLKLRHQHYICLKFSINSFYTKIVLDLQIALKEPTFTGFDSKCLLHTHVQFAHLLTSEFSIFTLISIIFMQYASTSFCFRPFWWLCRAGMVGVGGGEVQAKFSSSRLGKHTV